MAERIRTLVADDHPLLREGVVRSLDSEEDFEVVAEASTGEEAIELSADLVPDLVMLDLAMPGIGGIKAAERIAATSPASGILILTVLLLWLRGLGLHLTEHLPGEFKIDFSIFIPRIGYQRLFERIYSFFRITGF